MAGHVALVGETGGKRGFGQRLAAEHQPAGDVQPALDQVAVGAGAEQRAEIARQAPAFALGDLRQFVEAQRALQVRVDVLPGALGGDEVEVAPAARPVAGHGVEGVGQFEQGVLFFQRLQRGIHGL